MVRKFRKKPIVVEAFQMTYERALDEADWPQWLWDAKYSLLKEDPGSVSLTYRNGQLVMLIRTLESGHGAHTVTWGDWIIKGVQGELYPCKPDIFEATYEPVEEEN